MASTAPAVTSSASNFLTTHRRAVIVAASAAAVVAAGASIYYLSSPTPSSSSSTTSTSADKKKKKKSKGKKSVAGKTEGKGSEADNEESRRQSDPEVESLNAEARFLLPFGRISPAPRADFSFLSLQERAKLALSLKGRGNKAYSAKQYTQAIELYTKAIACEVQAVFYPNRAACYTNLNQLEKVVEDCKSASKLDPSYTKALNRRATARETLGGIENLFLALCDFTTAAIIVKFSTESTQEKATEILKTQEPRLPSATFVKAYLEAFRPHTPPTLPENPSDGNRTLILAFDALGAKNFVYAMPLFHEALAQGLSTPELEAEALDMRATFSFIVSDAHSASKDLDRSTELYPGQTQTWVKKVSVHMELGRSDEAFQDLDKALEIDPNDPDVFYHRGQVYFITGDYAKAIQQYQKLSELDPVFRNQYPHHSPFQLPPAAP